MNLAARIRFASHAIAIAAALAVAASAAAQTVIGGNGGGSVIVDYSVLDALGPPPNVPQMLMPPAGRAFPPPAPGAPMPRFPVVNDGRTDSASGGIVLKPPKEAAPRRRAAKAKPRPAPKAKPAAPPKVAARPPAPPPAPPSPAASVPPPPPAPPVAAKAPEPPPPAPSAPPPPKPAAAPPPPAAAPAPEPPKPAPTTVARTTPPPASAAVEPGQSLRVGFESGSAKLGPQASQQLKRIADGMSKDEQLRLQLLAYADGTSETASQARRLSLSRALAARSYLIGEGVRSTRIDVRALGNKSEGGPPDRIDIIITKR
jgi:outer membrane protein OmpA-like peptidoglycan-associated protein